MSAEEMNAQMRMNAQMKKAAERHTARATRLMAEQRRIRHYCKGFQKSRRQVKDRISTLRRQAEQKMIEAELLHMEAEKVREAAEANGGAPFGKVGRLFVVVTDISEDGEDQSWEVRDEAGNVHAEGLCESYGRTIPRHNLCWSERAYRRKVGGPMGSASGRDLFERKEENGIATFR